MIIGKKFKQIKCNDDTINKTIIRNYTHPY